MDSTIDIAKIIVATQADKFLLKMSSITPEQAHTLVQKNIISDKRHLYILAGRSDILDETKILMLQKEPSIISSALSDPTCSREIFEHCKNLDLEYKEYSFYPNMPYDMLCKIIFGNLPAEEIEAAIFKLGSQTQENFARNHNCPQHILNKFTNNENPNVRVAALLNPNVDPETFHKTIAEATRNPYTILLNQLVHSTLLTEEEALNIIALPGRAPLSQLALTPSCTPKVIETLYNTQDPSILKHLILNPATPAETLTRISAKHQDANTLSKIVKHQNTPEQLVKEIINTNQSLQILEAAIEAGKLPKIIVEKYVQKNTQPAFAGVRMHVNIIQNTPYMPKYKFTWIEKLTSKYLNIPTQTIAELLIKNPKLSYEETTTILDAF